jgi:hypothetical protein
MPVGPQLDRAQRQRLRYTGGMYTVKQYARSQWAVQVEGQDRRRAAGQVSESEDGEFCRADQAILRTLMAK